jgi:hypothetical protein
MLLFALIIIIVLCALPIAAALNIEIEKPLRNRSLRRQKGSKAPDDILVLPQPKLGISKPIEKKAA